MVVKALNRMARLFKLAALPWPEQRLYLKTALWLIAVKAGLLLFGFNRLRRFLEWRSHPASSAADGGEMTQIVVVIQRISAFLAPVRIDCLPQALVGLRLMRQKGFTVQMKIGVLKNHGDRLCAHAWLEYQGRVVLGDLTDLHQFTAFPALEAAQR
jgi:hypothetical protein